MNTFAARYNDGLTAASQIASVQLDAWGMLIRDAAGAELALWPLEEIHLVDRPTRGGPITLRRGHEADERLTIGDHAVLPELRAMCPNLMVTVPSQASHWRAVAIWGLAAVVSIAVILFAFIPYAARSVADALPAEWERSLGETAANRSSACWHSRQDAR